MSKKKRKVGRPKLPEDRKRVALQCRVLPETLEALGEYGTRGHAVDEAVKAWKDGKDA